MFFLSIASAPRQVETVRLSFGGEDDCKSRYFLPKTEFVSSFFYEMLHLNYRFYSVKNYKKNLEYVFCFINFKFIRQTVYLGFIGWNLVNVGTVVNYCFFVGFNNHPNLSCCS